MQAGVSRFPVVARLVTAATPRDYVRYNSEKSATKIETATVRSDKPSMDTKTEQKHQALATQTSYKHKAFSDIIK